jgi:chromosome segregation ATPase
MDFEQIVKRLEWLDQQQRENTEALSTIDARLTSSESSGGVVSKQVKTLGKQLTEMMPASKRVEQFEEMITKQRNDIIKLFEEKEKARTLAEKETAKRIQSELSDINTAISKFKTTADIPELRKQLKERTDEIQRILNNVSDLKTRVDESLRYKDDVMHSIKAVEETRKNDLKRITDVQGEISAIRKRVDESREKTTMNADTIRNIENRFTDLIASELERKQSQTAFFEQQAIAQIDRDRAWKDWKEKYDIFQKEAAGLDTHIQELDEAVRGAKKAQETYLELNTKLERRINEVTEMQRLAEDRVRQEWVSFKADDQKRWTGYSLSAEESFREIRKDVQKTEGRMTSLDDSAQVLQDQMHQTTDTTEKQLQELMNVVHEWMTSYQRIMGHGKKPKK